MAKQLCLLLPKEVDELSSNQKAPPTNVVGECKKCGKCCLKYQCPAAHPKTGQCRVYECRPIGCRVYPQDQFEIASVGCPGYHVEGL